jgi:hypothetical protein
LPEVIIQLFTFARSDSSMLQCGHAGMNGAVDAAHYVVAVVEGQCLKRSAGFDGGTSGTRRGK